MQLRRLYHGSETYGPKSRCGNRCMNSKTEGPRRGRCKEQRGSSCGKEDRGRSEGRWRKLKLNPNGLDAQIRLSSQQLHSRREGMNRRNMLCRCVRAANTLVHVHPRSLPALVRYECSVASVKRKEPRIPLSFLHAGRRIPGGASAKQPAGRSTRARKVNRMLVQGTKYFRRHA